MKTTRPLSSLLALALVGGCTPMGGAGEAPPSAPDAAVEGAPDAADEVPVATSCAKSGSPRAAVITVNGDEDAVLVMSLDGGELIDHGLRFTDVNIPRAVAMHPDGTEALVAWGGFGGAHGIAVYDIAPDGTSASLAYNLELGEGPTPYGIAYASADRVVFATAGSGAHNLVTIDRVNGTFTPGASSPVPDEWPLKLRSRPTRDEAVLARVNMTKDAATDVYRVTRDSEAWQATGSPAVVSPRTIDLAVHSAGGVAFSPTGDPADPLTPDNLEPGGLLQVIDIDGGMTMSSFPVPRRPSLMAAAPGGDFVVLSVAIFEFDPVSGTPVARHIALETVTTDEDGAPVKAYDITESFSGLLINDMAIAGSGHLLVSNEEYHGETVEAERHPLRVWHQYQPGSWEQCGTYFMDGSAKIAIAP